MKIRIQITEKQKKKREGCGWVRVVVCTLPNTPSKQSTNPDVLLTFFSRWRFLQNLLFYISIPMIMWVIIFLTCFMSVNQIKIVLKIDHWYERHGPIDHVDVKEGLF